MRHDLSTWGGVWGAMRSYRPDWYDGMCAVLIALILAAFGWYHEWTWQSLILGVGMIIIGMVSGEMVYPLWVSRRKQ